jgi:hypothetical protein
MNQLWLMNLATCPSFASEIVRFVRGRDVRIDNFHTTRLLMLMLMGVFSSHQLGGYQPSRDVCIVPVVVGGGQVQHLFRHKKEQQPSISSVGASFYHFPILSYPIKNTQ